jgi:hypothetical protein
LSSVAPVNAPFLCPKSSLSSRFSGSAAQFCATNSLSRAARPVVHGAGDELLAGARLALDEHRDARVDHLVELRDQLTASRRESMIWTV